MSVFERTGMYWRFAWGLREFLRTPITLEQSRQIIRKRLEEREENLLTVVKKAIYENQKSPYLKLLRIAGCEYGDFERLVRREGIEPALGTLRREGVYLSTEEFKGKKDVVRGNKSLRFRESDFDNPLIIPHLALSTGGSRSVATRTIYDFDHMTYGRAVYVITLLDAYGALDVPIAMWCPIMPGSGPRRLLEHAKVGKLISRWFSPVSEKSFNHSVKNRLGTNYIVYMGRLWGGKFPAPEYVSINDAGKIAQWLAQTVGSRGGCLLNTTPSNAVRICQAAQCDSLNITGVKFITTAEPLTKVKREAIESAGASVNSRYILTETGYIGIGCFHPTTPDDTHLLKDSFALIQHQRQVAHTGVSVDASLFTSLLLSAPKVLLNVESGDYGMLERKNCGCYYDKLGLSDHLHYIRGFDKLTSAGASFLGTDLIRIIEEVLPSKFGGTSIDYQMIEEEDRTGATRLSVIVSPEVGIVNEDELIRTVISELSKGDDGPRLMAKIWSDSGTLRVKRVFPKLTGSSKLLPLHIQKIGVRA